MIAPAMSAITNVKNTAMRLKADRLGVAVSIGMPIPADGSNYTLRLLIEGYLRVGTDLFFGPCSCMFRVFRGLP
ncbi:MAG TPA: hypothetical protein VFZ23_14595, partial [Pyrinomonadaceae bacterium]